MNHQLETHTIQFVQAVRDFGKLLPMTVANVEDLKALFRASGNVGAELIKAQKAPTKVDLIRSLRQCGAETRTSAYWLSLLDTQGFPELDLRRNQLIQAAQELEGVFLRIAQTTAVSS
ncbi:MAG: four helix bundle protein [Bacteroidia bacterium]|nr:four helix bundle protein [Bacteroidia bacterium]